jgi:hypothetical protein
MRLLRKEAITFEEKTYEIRVYYSDTIINVVTFLNNYPANGFRHQIHLPKKCNIQAVLREVMLDELIDTSKKDIMEKRWEKLSKIIQKNMTDA